MSDDYLINNTLFCLKRGKLIADNKTYLLSFTETKLLELLSKHANEVVTKEQLKAYAWPHTVVTDSSLTKSMAKLRQAFVTIFDNDEIIITIPRIGYKLISNVTIPPQISPSLMATDCDHNQYKNVKLSRKRIPHYCRLGLSILSVILLILSALNFLNIFPITAERYLNKDYQISVETNNSYKYQYITPKNQTVPIVLTQFLNDLNCNCTYFIEETQHRYSILIFDNDQKIATSFIVNKKTVIATLKHFIEEGKL